MRLSQPQGPAAIDSVRFPEIVIAVNPGTGGLNNLVKGTQPAISGASGITIQGVPGGRSARFSGSQSNALTWYGSGQLDGSNQLTVVIQFKLASLAVAPKPFSAWGSSLLVLPFEIETGGGSLSATADFAIQDWDAIGVPTFVVNKLYTVVFRLIRGSTPTLWVDGTRYDGTQTMEAGGGTFSGGDPWTLGCGIDHDSQVNGDVSLAVLSRKAWPDERCRAVSINPWQIFKPATRRIGLNVSSSNDISAAGSLSITGAAALNATGSLLAAGAVSITGAADLDASGSLSAAGALSISGAADLDASGSLVAAGALSISGAADLDATGSLVAAGALSITGAADLTGAGDNDIAALGSLSITGSAALNAIGQLSAAGSISITGVAQLDDGVAPEPEVETQKPAGSRKRRRKYLVEIDGQDFEVSSPQEAIALLARAKTVVSQAIEKAQATRVRPGIRRPVVRTDHPELRAVVQQANVEITSLYDSAVRDFEIAALMASKIEAEEEEAIIRLLM